VNEGQKKEENELTNEGEVEKNQKMSRLKKKKMKSKINWR
jgi:hypothetical protein